MGSSATLAQPVTIGRLWILVGCLAVVFPAAYIAEAGWGSGEHAGVVIAFGVGLSVIHACFWMAMWKVCGSLRSGTRQAMFGAGATIALTGSILAGNAMESLAAAGVTYFLLASIAVFAAHCSRLLRPKD